MIDQRLQSLGIELPTAPRPLGQYVPAVEAGGLLFLSGQLPLHDGRLVSRGRIGDEVSPKEAGSAGRIAALNGFATARTYLGTLDRIHGLVRLGVTMATTPDFIAHAGVADEISGFIAEILGAEASGHTRLISGASVLPLGSPLVLELIFALKRGG